MNPPQRVFWFGRHPQHPEWKNPLGRVHSPRGACGALLDEHRTLEDLGFRELDIAAGEFAVPALTWLDRHGARGYEGAAGSGVVLRQLPHEWLDVLDDKRCMHELLLLLLLRERGTATASSAGSAEWPRLPDTYLAEDFMSMAVDAFPADNTVARGPGQAEEVCSADSVAVPVTEGTAFYTKHARGIKGNQVDRHSSAAAARAWLDALPLQSSAGLPYERHPADRPALDQYIVQREVQPLLLQLPPADVTPCRRFCLRQHVLLLLPPLRLRRESRAAPRGYAHRDVVIMPHAETGSGKPAHVQQAGSEHPRPSLLANTDPVRGAALRAFELPLPGVDADLATAQLEASARVVLECFVRHVVVRSEATGERKQVEEQEEGGGRKEGDETGEHSGWLYNVFGFDLVLEGGTAEPVLLEVNVYPAIAGGTMGGVPRGVYARLVDDTLRLLAPVIDTHPLPPPSSPPPRLGGFADLKLRSSAGDDAGAAHERDDSVSKEGGCRSPG